MSHAMMSSFLGFAVARAVLGLGEGATFPGGLRTAVETLPAHLRARGIALSFSGGTIGAVMMPLLLGPLAIKYGWRAAFLTTGALGADLAGHLGGRSPGRRSCPPRRRSRRKLTWPELQRAPRLGAGLQLRAARDFARARADDPVALSHRAARADAGGRQPAGVDSAAHLGHRLLLLGLGRRSLRGQQRAAGRAVPAPHRRLADARRRDVDDVGAGGDGADLVLDVHRRRIPDGGAQGRLLRVPARAGGDDVRHRVGLVVARQLRPAARRSAPGRAG